MPLLQPSAWAMEQAQIFADKYLLEACAGCGISWETIIRELAWRFDGVLAFGPRPKAPTGWKAGDWCFADMELCQIKEVDEQGRVNEVTTGVICQGFHDLPCFPVTLQHKWTAHIFHETLQKFHRIEGPWHQILNFPRIAAYIEREWVLAAQAVEDGDLERCAEIQDKMYDWHEEAKKAMRQPVDLANPPVIGGVSLVRDF